MRITKVAMFSVLGFLLVVSAGAQEPKTYGSIALSKLSTPYGFSHSHKSLVDAERAALKDCSKRARDCEIFKSIENDCIALSIADNAAAGWAAGGDKGVEERKARALKECNDRMGRGCRFKVHFCTNGSNIDR